MDAKRRAALGIVGSVLFAAVWLLLTVPRGHAAQTAGKPGSRSRLAVAGALRPAATAAISTTDVLTATTTISSTNPAFAAPDVPLTQSLSPQIGPQSLLTPVSLEVESATGGHPIYRVVASQPTKDGAWKPQIPAGRAAWLSGTVVNQVFCLPAATLPVVKAGDSLLVRTSSGAPLRYTIEAVRADVGWQQTEVLSQRRNGVTVLGCGGPDTAPRHVWFATFRLEDQPDTPAVSPAASPTPAAPPPLEMVAIGGHIMANTMQPGSGNELLITLQVINRSNQPVPLDPHAVTVLDGSTGGALPLVEGLPTTVPPSKDRQTLTVGVKPPAQAMAVLQTDARFGDRRWHLMPQTK
jgi:hypothetical protein